MKTLHPCAVVVLTLTCLLGVASSPRPARAETILLVVEAARDTTAGFRAQELPRQGRRALTWPQGVITVPDTTAWLEHEGNALAVRLDASTLAAVGAGGRFGGEPGSYKLDMPLYVGDGNVVACLAAGKLIVAPDRIVYRAPGVKRDRRGDLMLLGGLILATAVLLRAARRRTKRS